MSFEHVSLDAAADALEKFAFEKRADMSEVGYGGLIGAGTGAGLGLLHERFIADKRKKKNYLASALAGGVAGGAVGAGAGALMDVGNTPASNKTSLRDLSQKVDAARDNWNPFAYGPAKRELEAAGGKARNELDLMGSLTPSNGLLAPVNVAGVAGAGIGAAAPTLFHRRNSLKEPMTEQELEASTAVATKKHPSPQVPVRPKRPTAPKEPHPAAGSRIHAEHAEDVADHSNDREDYRKERTAYRKDLKAYPAAKAEADLLQPRAVEKDFRETRRKAYIDKTRSMRNAGHSLVGAGAGYVTGSALDELMRYFTHTDSKTPN